MDNSLNIIRIYMEMMMLFSIIIQSFYTIELMIIKQKLSIIINVIITIVEISYFILFVFPLCNQLSLVNMILLSILHTLLLFYSLYSFHNASNLGNVILNPSLIKEGCDNLPEGICFFDDEGNVTLINRKMLSIGLILFGSEIQTIEELRYGLKNPLGKVKCLDLDNQIFQFPDDTILCFSVHEFQGSDDTKAYEVIATDVSELYRKQIELNQENMLLSDINQNLRELIDNMSDIVKAKEILDMKIKIHDDIGFVIMAAKQSLTNHLDLKILQQNAYLWADSLTVLNRANLIQETSDEWDIVNKRAIELGVEMIIEGDIDTDNPYNRLLFLTLKEALTNCVRHGKANKLYLKIIDEDYLFQWKISDNGKKINKKIIEGGGLSNIRYCIEEKNGKLEIIGEPQFMLIITFYKDRRLDND